jgi:NADPH-dependent 7-cyano-7-deazaguanine reductase QueF
VSADPYRLRLVPDTSEALVTVTGQLVHECPHVPEHDAGTVEIAWRCADMTIELHSLSTYLASWQGETISHEEITAQIARDLDALDGIEVERVRTRWTTAGFAVAVDR